MPHETQLDLFDFAAPRRNLPSRRSPRDVGVAGARAAYAAAGRSGWDGEAAGNFIVRHLQDNGPTPGEELVALAKKAGHDPRLHCRDDRAFGGVFLSLQRKGLIFCSRSDLPRAKGHGTSGGREWVAC